MPTIAENFAAWNTSYDWPLDGHEWGNFSQPFLQRILKEWLEPYIENKTVIEIGPGHGRWTDLIVPKARKLTLVDLSSTCLEFCKKRYRDFNHIEYIQNQGDDLKAIPNNSADFIWSFNVFVHMEKKETAAYFNEFKRVLKPAGKCVFDHPGRKHAFLPYSFLRKFGCRGEDVYRHFSLGARAKKSDGWRSNISKEVIMNLVHKNGFRILKHEHVWPSEPGSNHVRNYNDYIICFEKTKEGF